MKTQGMEDKYGLEMPIIKRFIETKRPAGTVDQIAGKAYQ
jgi:hypothetical protein